MLVIKVSLITLFTLLQIPTLVSSQPLSNPASRYDVIERRTSRSSDTLPHTTAPEKREKLPVCSLSNTEIHAVLKGLQELACATLLEKTKAWGHFEAVATGFKVGDGACKIPRPDAPQTSIGTCFISFLDIKGEHLPKETRQDIRLRVEALHKLGLKFTGYDLALPDLL